MLAIVLSDTHVPDFAERLNLDMMNSGGGVCGRLLRWPFRDNGLNVQPYAENAGASSRPTAFERCSATSRPPTRARADTWTGQCRICDAPTVGAT